MPAVRVAGAEDLDAAVACLTSAFFADPVWGDWAFPDERTRGERLARLMGFWTRSALPHGWVRVTADVEAVAAWTPPGVPELTPAEEAEMGPLVDELFGPRAGEMNELLAQFEAHHPSEPHYYLGMLGTHRDHAGQSIGTRLLSECLALVDAEAMSAYLESSNPANLARYEALGFRARSQFGLAGGPVLTTMWREAR